MPEPQDMTDDALAAEAKSIDDTLKLPVSDGNVHIDEVVRRLSKRMQLMNRRLLIQYEIDRRVGFPGLAQLGSNPLTLRADEVVPSGDKFRFQTFRVTGPNITIKVPTKSNPTQTWTGPKTFTVFVPTTASADVNKVHVFFTPLPDESKFVAEEGLRLQHDGTPWILIAVPGAFEDWTPNYITISTAEIQDCLTKVHRSKTTIDALRLTAHSRGHRSLERTLGLGSGTPLVDPAIVERVTVFDASYHDLGAVLATQQSKLVKMTTSGKWNKDAIELIDVTVANISGLVGTALGVSAMRGLFYVRLVQNGLALGTITNADVEALATTPKDLKAATQALLAAIPARGSFSTKSPTPAGKTDLGGFLKGASASNLALVDDLSLGAGDITYTNTAGKSVTVRLGGLSKFVVDNGLDMGYSFDLAPDMKSPPSAKKPDRTLTAHHWIPAELTHEAVE